MVKRIGRVLIPNGDLIMQEGDRVIMYTQLHMNRAHTIEV